jgi:hypothetical protein
MYFSLCMLEVSMLDGLRASGRRIVDEEFCAGWLFARRSWFENTKGHSLDCNSMRLQHRRVREKSRKTSL